MYLLWGKSRQKLLNIVLNSRSYVWDAGADIVYGGYCCGPPQINQCMGNTGDCRQFLSTQNEQYETRRARGDFQLAARPGKVYVWQTLQDSQALDSDQWTSLNAEKLPSHCPVRISSSLFPSKHEATYSQTVSMDYLIRNKIFLDVFEKWPLSRSTGTTQVYLDSNHRHNTVATTTVKFKVALFLPCPV